MFLNKKQKGDKMDTELIGKKIKALMTIRNMKRSDLAKELNISYNTLTKKLNGKREFNINEVLRIKEIFNMDVELCANIFFNDDFLISTEDNKKIN